MHTYVSLLFIPYPKIVAQLDSLLQLYPSVVAGSPASPLLRPAFLVRLPSFYNQNPYSKQYFGDFSNRPVPAVSTLMARSATFVPGATGFPLRVMYVFRLLAVDIFHTPLFCIRYNGYDFGVIVSVLAL